jgi:3-deoxy-7-phosphoheptulonate synthase
MLIVMQNNAAQKLIDAVCARIESLGFEPHSMPGAQRTAICITGNDGSVSKRHFADLHGIREIIQVSKPYKLTSNETQSTPTTVTVGSTNIGPGSFQIIAGPLHIESRDTAMRIAKALHEKGVTLFRANTHRPRMNPYSNMLSFDEGLTILSEIKAVTGMAVATDVEAASEVAQASGVADLLIVETHNMRHVNLLRALGKANVPVLLKRSSSATLQEFLMAAEYIMSGGNRQVILCDGGVCSFGEHSAYALDMTFVPALQQLTHLPVMMDPSQAAGSSFMVPALMAAAKSLGASGVLVDVHDDPAHSMTGGTQAITPEVL